MPEYSAALDNIVLKLERKSGWFLSAVIVALLFMIAAAIYIGPERREIL